MLWIPKDYCVVKKLVWNVRINAFWYTKVNKIFIVCTFVIIASWNTITSRIIPIKIWLFYNFIYIEMWLFIPTYLCKIFRFQKMNICLRKLDSSNFNTIIWFIFIPYLPNFFKPSPLKPKYITPPNETVTCVCADLTSLTINWKGNTLFVFK